MDAFPNEGFTVRDASEAAGSIYSTTGYYLENFTQRGILKVEKKPGCTSVSSHSPFSVSVTVQLMGVTAPKPLLEKSVQSAGYTQIIGIQLDFREYSMAEFARIFPI